ncbi:MAG: polysaccharide biosynthesis tyrosine autokinase [Acidobacteriaceae bacterium]|nr:polysaccharide biosynthesis tyrosine autokinase [Acidobacteriaceae bacterium]
MGGGDTSYSTATQIAILKSQTLLLSVARDLDLANNREFLNAKGPMKHASLDDPATRESIVGMLDSSINVTSVPKTDIISISGQTLNAKLSADIVNHLMTEYIRRSMQTRFDATKRASDFLSGQLGDLKDKVEDSQARVIELGKKIGVLGFDPTKNQIASNLDMLTHAVGEAEIHRILSGSRYQILNKMDPGALDTTIDVATRGTTAATPLTQLRTQREEARVQLAQISTDLGPKNPRVEAVQAEINELTVQIDNEQKRLLIQAHEEYSAARADENGTRSALESEKADAYRLRDDLLQYTLLQRDFESSRTLYESLNDRLRSAGIQAGLEATEIDIVDYAHAPVNPSMERASTVMLINFLVLTIVGLIVVFIVDSLDTGIQTVSELESISGLPSLALIPRARRANEAASASPAYRNLGVLNSPRSQFAEAFRALRTSLLLSTLGGEPKLVLLTSSTPSEGKTTAALNLAFVMAQREVRVLLIDADLRRPSVHHRLGLNAKIGLTTVLAGASTLEEAIQTSSDMPSLDILVSGPVPPFPTEMLGSNAMHELLKKVRGQYTHIVLDSPPLLSVTDSVILARDADAVILIVRHGKSTRQAIRRSRDLLERVGARMAGLALNAVDLNSPEYYAYYGYSGYSAYGSGGVEKAAWDTQNETAEKASKEGRSR